MIGDARKSAASALHEWFRCDVEGPLAARVGGLTRLHVIVLLGSVLALDSADKAMVGAVAGQLENSLHVGNVEVGWLVTASTGVGALFTLPFSVFADRTSRRTRLLAIAIVVWSAAMAAGAASPSFWMLLGSRLLLGGAMAHRDPR